jgi:hypothetical protein
MSDQVQSEPSPDTDPFDELDTQTKRDIDQLLDQGCLSEAFTFGGHSFVIKTLNASEANSVATAMQRYQGTVREVQAYMQATIGLALFSFDGDTEFHKRVGDMITHAAKRFEWVGQFDDVIVAHVFNRYNELDKRRIHARESLVNLQEPGPSLSTPWPGSSTELDTFSVGAPTESPYSPS